MFRVEDNKNKEYMKKILMITMMVVAAVAMHAQLPNVQLKGCWNGNGGAGAAHGNGAGISGIFHGSSSIHTAQF